jgi:hypothetical protein
MHSNTTSDVMLFNTGTLYSITSEVVFAHTRLYYVDCSVFLESDYKSFLWLLDSF